MAPTTCRLTFSAPPPRKSSGLLEVPRRPDTSANATIGQGTTIEVLLDGKHRFQLDGGSKGTTDELHFSVRPGALTMCAPAS